MMVMVHKCLFLLYFYSKFSGVWFIISVIILLFMHQKLGLGTHHSRVKVWKPTYMGAEFLALAVRDSQEISHYWLLSSIYWCWIPSNSLHLYSQLSY